MERREASAVLEHANRPRVPPRVTPAASPDFPAPGNLASSGGEAGFLSGPLFSSAREQQEILRMLFRQAATPIVVLDPGGTVVDVNEAALASCGFTKNRQYHRKFWETLWCDRSSREKERIRSAVEAAAAGVQSELDATYGNALGEERWIELCFTPLHDAACIVAILVEGHDISVCRAAKQRITDARDTAERAMKAKEAFFALLAHELRTPLQPIMLIAGEAADDDALTPLVRAHFQTIARQASMEARLIDDVLDLTRIVHGKMALNLEQLDLHALLRDALSAVDAEIRQKQLDIVLRFDANRPSIQADGLRLQQVFWNLLKNAVKFTPIGGRVVIETCLDVDHHKVTIRVVDSGIGITGEEMDRLFRPFSQGDHANGGGSRVFGGLGLGLVITRGIIKLHSGQISAESAGRGKGACFTVELPTIGSPVGDHRDALLLQSTAAGTAPGRPSRMLIVEDHAASRAALARILKRRHCEVLVAGSVGEALAAVAEEGVDLVLSDITLPDGDGYQLLAALRDRYPDVIAVAMSGHGSPADIERSRQAGFVSHLTKPIRLQTLATVLDSISHGMPDGLQRSGLE